MANQLLLYGKRKPGRPTLTYLYLDQPKRDTGLTMEELKVINMEDRKMWRDLVMSVWGYLN